MLRNIVCLILAIFMFASLRPVVNILEKIIGCDVLKQNQNQNNNNDNNNYICNNKEVRICLLLTVIIIGSLFRININNRFWKTIIIFLQIFYTISIQKEIYDIINTYKLPRIKKITLLFVCLITNILLINRFSKPLMNTLKIKN